MMNELEKSVEEQEVSEQNNQEQNQPKIEEAVITNIVTATPPEKKPEQAPGCHLCRSGEKHMYVILEQNGNVHVHAPWGNRYLMNEFMEAIFREQERFNKINHR